MAILIASWTGPRGVPTRASQGQLVFSPSSLLPAFVEALKASGVAHAPADEWGPSVSIRFQDRKEAIIAIFATVGSAQGYHLSTVLPAVSGEQNPTTEYIFTNDAARATPSDTPLRQSQEAHSTASITPPAPSSGIATPVPLASPAVSALASEDRSLRGSGTGARPATPSAAPSVDVGPRLTSDATYFHGPISDANAAELLENLPAGAFLARNSTSSPATCIIISCKEGTKILHFRLWKLSTGRFSLEKAPQAKDAVFPTLQDFVNAHPNHFKVPVEKAASGYGAFDE